MVVMVASDSCNEATVRALKGNQLVKIVRIVRPVAPSAFGNRFVLSTGKPEHTISIAAAVEGVDFSDCLT